MTSIVVTGSAGQLGTAFRKRLGTDGTYLDRSQLDLGDTDAIAEVLVTLGPRTVINCAAYTAVDAAESDPETARAINAVAVGRLAEVCADIGARFVTYSTDYVFDGTKATPYLESDAPDPINMYGRSKREGEIAAVDALGSSLIIRTSWVMSATHRSFASVILGHMRRGVVKVVDDQIGHPTFVDDLVTGTLDALDAEAEGIVHLANDGVASWYDVAVAIAEQVGIDPGDVHPCSTAEYPTPARRPANSVLDSERIQELGLSPMRDYRVALAEVVEHLP